MGEKALLARKRKILVLHGPNLNLLGVRETKVYGTFSLKEVDRNIRAFAKQEGIDVSIKQSNSEGEIVGFIQKAINQFDGLLINPAAYTHTSIALHDAILGTNIPTVEVHLSNIYSREEFRRKSYVSSVALGQISGFGMNSYLLGLRALIGHFNQK